MAAPSPTARASQLVHATVFSDAAHVTRRVEATLDAGLNRLAIPDLPADLDIAQLRVSPSAGHVRYVEIDDLTLEEPPDAARPDERARVEAEQTVHRLTGEQAALAAELALIDRVVPGRGLDDPASGVLRPDVFLSGLDTLTKRRRELLYAIRVAEYQLHLAQEALADLRALEDAGAITREDLGRQSVLVIGLDLDDAADVQVDLTYTAGWASWRPYYTLRLDPGSGRIEVGRFADLWQVSKEDWVQVSLRLSTGEPETGLVLPEVPPWILERRRSYTDDARQLYKRRSPPPLPLPSAPPAGPPSAIPAPAAASFPPEAVVTMDLETDDVPPDVMDAYAQQFEEEGIFAEVSSTSLSASHGPHSSAPPGDAEDGDHLGALPPPPPPRPGPRRWRPPPDHPDLPRLLEHAKPRAASGGIDFELEVPGRFTCRTGRDRQRVGLGARSYPAALTYLLRPGVKDHAFGRVTVVNEAPMPLLAGPAALFVEDAYFGTSRLLTTPAGGKLQLELGAEPGIECARRAHTQIRTEGLISKEDVHRVHVTIEIESHLAHPVPIEVQDQLPVSGDPKVKVELQRTTPAHDHEDTRAGILTWRLELEPGRPQRIELVYEIEAPKDYQLVQSLGATL